MATTASHCPWDVDVDQRNIYPIDSRYLREVSPEEQDRYARDEREQRQREKHLAKQEVIEDLTYYVPERETYDDRDAPSAFSAIFGKSSSSSQKSDDSKRSNRSLLKRLRTSRGGKKERDDKNGEWSKIR